MAQADARRAYVDTGIFVCCFVGGTADDPEVLARSQSVLEEGQRGTLQLVLSPLVQAEVSGCGETTCQREVNETDAAE